jgi:hypothetical protein
MLICVSTQKDSSPSIDIVILINQFDVAVIVREDPDLNLGCVMWYID